MRLGARVGAVVGVGAGGRRMTFEGKLPDGWAFTADCLIMRGGGLAALVGVRAEELRCAVAAAERCVELAVRGIDPLVP